MDIQGLDDKLSSLDTFRDVLEVMKVEFDALGFVEFIFLFQVVEKFIGSPLVVYYTFNEQWLSHYMQCNYSMVDPVMKHYISKSTPLFWSVDDDWSHLGEGSVEFMKDCADHGYYKGVCVPIYTVECTRGFVNLIVDDFSSEVVRNVASASFLLRYFHHHTVRIWEEKKPGNNRDKRLTDREIEVFMWVADGLTSNRIGEKLGMSKRTVDQHIANVQDKLGCDNRQQALCKSISLGLLHPSRDYAHFHNEIEWVF